MSRTDVIGPGMIRLGITRPGFARPAIFRTASFRLAVGACVILAGASLLQFGLIGWQTERFEHARVDRLIEHELADLAREPPADLAWHIEGRFGATLRTLPVAGLFDRTGRRLDGDVAAYPAALPPDGRARAVEVRLADGSLSNIRAAARTLPGGLRLMIGRDLRELVDLRRIMRRALLLSFLPGLALSLAGGAWLGHRALLRVGHMHRTIERIVAGGLHERLPSSEADDDLERLAGSVNRMLDRIEHLLAEVRGVGDDIAHDLRTPLARVRATLEGTRNRAVDPDAWRAGIDRAITDLDRVFVIIDALLRIAEIEGRRRRAGFGPADLGEIASDAIELYEPLAEGRSIALSLAIGEPAIVEGDRDLLMEAVANLLDNAVKFTPPGGHVVTEVGRDGGRACLAVADDGIGVPDADLPSVLKRFYPRRPQPARARQRPRAELGRRDRRPARGRHPGGAAGAGHALRSDLSTGPGGLTTVRAMILVLPFATAACADPPREAIQTHTGTCTHFQNGLRQIEDVPNCELRTTNTLINGLQPANPGNKS